MNTEESDIIEDSDNSEESVDGSFDCLISNYYMYESKENDLTFNLLWDSTKLACQLYNRILYDVKTCGIVDGGKITDYPKSVKAIGHLWSSDLNSPYQKLSQKFGSNVDNTILHFMGSIKGFISSYFDYFKDREKYLGKPKFPRYCHNPREFYIRFHGNSPMIIKDLDDNNYYIKLGVKDSIKFIGFTPFIQIPSNIIEFLQKRIGISEIPIKGSDNKVQIIPLNNSKFVELQIVPIISKSRKKNDKKTVVKKVLKICITYKLNTPVIPIMENNPEGITLAIDFFGVKNFMAGITTNPNLKPFIIRGNQLVHTNHYYNGIIQRNQRKIYKNTRIQINDTDCIRRKVKRFNLSIPLSENSQNINYLRFKRKLWFNDFYHKVGAWLIQYCKENHITKVIIGRNKQQKQNDKKKKGRNGIRKFSRQNTQDMTQIAHGKCLFIISYLLKMNHIQKLEYKEPFTSKSDHFAEELMNYGLNAKVKNQLGERRKMILKDQQGNPIYYKDGEPKTVRGLFKSPSTGKVINSDINGSIGHMRNYFADMIKTEKNTPELQEIFKKQKDQFIIDINNSKIIFQPITIKFETSQYHKSDRVEFLEKGE